MKRITKKVFAIAAREVALQVPAFDRYVRSYIWGKKIFQSQVAMDVAMNVAKPKIEIEWETNGIHMARDHYKTLMDPPDYDKFIKEASQRFFEYMVSILLAQHIKRHQQLLLDAGLMTERNAAAFLAAKQEYVAENAGWWLDMNGFDVLGLQNEYARSDVKI